MHELRMSHTTATVLSGPASAYLAGRAARNRRVSLYSLGTDDHDGKDAFLKHEVFPQLGFDGSILSAAGVESVLCIPFLGGNDGNSTCVLQLTSTSRAALS